MKKALLFLLMLPFMASCSSSNDEAEEGFEFIQLEMNVTNTNDKEASLALFYGWKGTLKSANFRYVPHEGTMAVGSDDSGEYVFPVTGQYAIEDDIKNGNLLHVFYEYQMSPIYGSTKDGGQFAIAIGLDGESDYKVFSATKNTKVNVTYDGSSKSFNWSVRDY